MGLISSSMVQLTQNQQREEEGKQIWSNYFTAYTNISTYRMPFAASYQYQASKHYQNMKNVIIGLSHQKKKKLLLSC